MDFDSRYKKRTIQFRSSENSRAVRAVKYAENRRAKRGDVVLQRRQMDISSTEDSFIDTSQRDDKENKEVALVFQEKKTYEELAEERYQKLLKWRDERRKIMELEKRKKKPAFKTGLYHPDNPKYLVSDTDMGLSESRLNLTRTPAKCSSATKPAKVWHNVSSTAGTPSQAQMKPILRFHTGVTPTVGSVKPKVVRGLITSQKETLAPHRASSRLASRFSKDTPARKTSYRKKKISNVIIDKEPVGRRYRHKKESKCIDTSSFMSFAPENFVFEAPKGIDAITSTEFGSKSSITIMKDSKVLQPPCENSSDCEEEEMFYPAEDFCLDEEKPPEVNLPKMTTPFVSSRNHQYQHGDDTDQSIGTEECLGSDGQLHDDEHKESDCVDSSAEKENAEEEENVSLKNEDVGDAEECIGTEEKVEVECKENEVKDNGVENTEEVCTSGTDSDYTSPKEYLDQPSTKKGSTEAFTSPVAAELSWKNTTPKLSSQHQSSELEENHSGDEELKSLFLKVPNCHHEHEEILVSPVRPRTRRSFAIAQQVVTPSHPIRVQTPCSRKTRRSLVAHSDLSPTSLVYTPDTKPGRRRSVRRSVMTPQENCGSLTNSDDTKENAPHEEPTPCSHRKGKGRRSSRRSFLRDVSVENQGVLLEVDESVNENRVSIVVEKKPSEVISNEISAGDQEMLTPQDNQGKRPIPLLIKDSPFVTVTRGSSSKKKRRGGVPANDLKGLFDDIPTDGSPLPAYLISSIESKEEYNEHTSPVQDPTCTNLLALLEPSSPKEDVTDSVASVWDEFTPAKTVQHSGNSEPHLLIKNQEDASNLVTPSVPKQRGGKGRRSVTFNVEESENSVSFKFPVTPLHSSLKKATREIDTLYEDPTTSPMKITENLSQLESSANEKKIRGTRRRSRVSLLPGLPINSPAVASDSVHKEPPTMKFFSVDTPMRASAAVTPRRSRRLSKAVL